jgi:hypothetical protein
MPLKKDKNYPKMISFLLSAENPEHALRTPTEKSAKNLID